jgi:quercetin dioxygenase-like cupin family protein
MPTRRRPLVLCSLAIGAALWYRTAALGFAQQPPARGLAFDQKLPEMDGKKLNMKVVDIRVPPGAKSTPHTHGCAVVVYVISGAMRMQVRGGPDSVYRAGGTFYERPTDVHQMSDNASATDSAHFTATFVCDHVGALSTPVPPADYGPTTARFLPRP